MDLRAIQGYSNNIIGLVFYIFVPTVIAIAFLTFLWGIYKYFILGADSDSERETGRQFALWGIIGFAVIVSVWGLVWMVIYTLGVGPTAAPPPPSISL